MMHLIRQLITDETGADATEYALIAGALCLATLVGGATFASSLQLLFNTVVARVDASIPTL